jgi:hypothetical protein
MIMPRKQPLADWDHVERAVFDPAGSSLSFVVTDNGMWTERLTSLVPNPPKPEMGHLTKWEFRILDALVDQINREPIPEPVQWNGPAREDAVGDYLDLDNGPATYRLLSHDRGGSFISADDKLDVLEIAALDKFMEYLEHKYGSFSADAIIG